MDIEQLLRNRIYRGAESKIGQYEEYAPSRCHDPIDLNTLIGQQLFGKTTSPSFIVINLDRDATRLNAVREELKKLSVNDFYRLRGSDGRNKLELEADLNLVLDFLDRNEKGRVEINEFSEANHEWVTIQEGPLGCYCSHMRAIMHGLNHFDDYTVVIEDDAIITDTNLIREGIEKIPDDWDIIFLNSAPKNRRYEEKVYKFSDSFHSAHFYIIRNRSIPRLLKFLYPVNDQVDILLADSILDLNIYNIAHCVYQKNLATNTQNNLYTIFSSPSYEVLRREIDNIETWIGFFAEKILPDNPHNRKISKEVLFDVVYGFILSQKDFSHHMKESFDFNHADFQQYEEYTELLISLSFFLRCCKKGIDYEQSAFVLMSAILKTLALFRLHGTFDVAFGQRLNAFSFGSTAHTYLSECGDIVVKDYNAKLRWVGEFHDNPEEIFSRELGILRSIQHLKNTPELLFSDQGKLWMSYCGESLYHNFSLPKNWESQIEKLFQELEDAGIGYPEMKLQNILVKDSQIHFVDFGLATTQPNKNHSRRLIAALDKLDRRLSCEDDPNRRLILIDSFFRNQGQIV